MYGITECLGNPTDDKIRERLWFAIILAYSIWDAYVLCIARGFKTYNAWHVWYGSRSAWADICAKSIIITFQQSCTHNQLVKYATRYRIQETLLLLEIESFIQYCMGCTCTIYENPEFDWNLSSAYSISKLLVISICIITLHYLIRPTSQNITIEEPVAGCRCHCARIRVRSNARATNILKADIEWHFDNVRHFGSGLYYAILFEYENEYLIDYCKKEWKKKLFN